MTGKSKRENGGEQAGKTGARSARGQFTKGGQPGPGRGHRGKGRDLARQRTPRAAAAVGGIACEEPERAERELDRLRSELADALARLSRAGRDWSVTLQVLEAHPAARRAVLDGVLKPDDAAESPAPPGRSPAAPAAQGPAGAGTACGPGDPESRGAAGDDPQDWPRGVREQMAEQGLPYGGGGVTPNRPAGRPGDRNRDELLLPDSPRPRRGDPYGDSGPLTSHD